VEPVDYPVDHHQVIYFYVTHNRGLTWALDAESQPIIVKGTLTFNLQDLTQKCTLDNAGVSGPAPVVASASPATLWILTPGPKGATGGSIVTSRGSGPSTFKIEDLPKTTDRMDLAALNGHDALLTLPMPSGYQSTYETTNAGVSWEMATFPVPRGT
jgi:hypothetical protein